MEFLELREVLGGIFFISTFLVLRFGEVVEGEC